MSAAPTMAQAQVSGGLHADRPALAPPRPLPSGFDALADQWVGAIRRLPWRAYRLRQLAQRCADQMVGLQALSDEQLQLALKKHRDAFRRDMSGGQGALLAALATVGAPL